MEYISSLSNGIVQFEDDYGFSSASAPPDGIFMSEDGTMIISAAEARDPQAVWDSLWEQWQEAWMHGEANEDIVSAIHAASLKNDPHIGLGWAMQYLKTGNHDATARERTISWYMGLSNQELEELLTKPYVKEIWMDSMVEKMPPEVLHQMMSEEGNAPIQDPMELGEMANWTPLDGSEGLKRKRAESEVFALTYSLNNDVIIEDITDMNEALQLYLELSVDIAEMENLGLQKHPRYPIAKKLLSDLSYRLDDLQTEMPDITPEFEFDAEYDAWRSAFADGAATTLLHRYDRNWMNKVNNPKSRHMREYWNEAKPEFVEELRSAEVDDRRNQLTPDGERDGFYISNITDEDFQISAPKESFLQRLPPLSWGLGMVAAFLLGKKL